MRIKFSEGPAALDLPNGQTAERDVFLDVTDEVLVVSLLDQGWQAAKPKAPAKGTTPTPKEG